MKRTKLSIEQETIEQELRQLMKETLTVARSTPVAQRRAFVRKRLSDIQTHCQNANKTFIFCELRITCDQHALGGSSQHAATLFRGPCESASVAICVTDGGSLLHRNDSPWRVYCNAGDVNPNAITIERQSIEKQLVA